jgi:ATP-dependent DNA ligase
MELDGNDGTTLVATAEWRPMAFGDRAPSAIADPLYEPLWPGHRALVDVYRAGVTIRGVELGPLAGAAGLRSALAEASRAEELVIDGYVVPAPLDRPPAAAPEGAISAGLSTRSIWRQLFVGSRLGREPGRRRGDSGPPVAPLPPDAPIGFVAIDLLWLDGEPLLHVPLGERRRLLESVLLDSALVRRIVAVTAPVERWYEQWRRLGFREVAVKGINSRYGPGTASDEWTIIAIPRG